MSNRGRLNRLIIVDKHDKCVVGELIDISCEFVRSHRDSLDLRVNLHAGELELLDDVREALVFSDVLMYWEGYLSCLPSRGMQ